VKERSYRVLLRLLPRALREKHGDAMQALFLERLCHAQRDGWAAIGAAWLHAILDVGSEAWRQRARRSRPARPRRVSMLGSDLRQALRLLLRAHFASLLVVGMLALGIAANVAVFSLVNGLFLRPFPFPDPERLVFVNEKAPRWNLEVVGVNYPDFHQWRASQKAFEAMAVYDTVSYNLSDGSRAERVSGARVSHDFLDVLRVPPRLGRNFTPDEDKPKANPVVMIGAGLWQERFGGAPDVLGRSLRLNGVAHTIVGVFPPEAEFPEGARLFVPNAGDPNQQGQSYGGSAIARLKAGVSVADAELDLLRAHAPIWEARDREQTVSPYVRPLREMLVGEFATAAGALTVAVALLLVVACANVAALMLARAIGRRRELAIRIAVGASRWSLLRQLFAENLLLSVAGGLAGVVAGGWAVGVLVAAVPDEVPRWAQFGLDGRVAGFAILVTLATAVLFGFAPAIQAVRSDLRGAMHPAAGGTTASPRGRRTLFLLVGAEFALAALLLVSGGLLLKAWERVRTTDPGFRTSNVLAFSMSLPEAAYPDAERRLAFWERLIGRLQALPGVDGVGAITCVPFGCHWGSFFEAEGKPRSADDPNPVVLYRYASAGYFETLGLRLLAGRFFQAEDGHKGRGLSVVVNRSFQRAHWPDAAAAVGRRLRRQSSTNDSPWYTVVGVVEDVRHYGLERPMRPGIYLPLPEETPGNLSLVLHAAGDPTALTASARAIVQELDPDLALFRVQTMEQALLQSLRTRAVYSWMLAVFAVQALLLALGGSYGVTSYLASQRSREIGIRLALGARGADVAASVLRSGLRVVVAGVAAGVLVSLGAGRLLSTLLFGIAPHDGLVLAASGGTLLIAGLLANVLPAWRAARLDPVQTLRME